MMYNVECLAEPHELSYPDITILAREF
jgi:hypothetical protein